MTLKYLFAAGMGVTALASMSNAALTGWWQFDDLSDSSGNGHNVSLHGNASLAPTGGPAGGGVLVLDGSGDWADVPNSPDHSFVQGEDFTITLFYNGPASDTNNGLITNGYADNPREPTGYYLLQVTNNQQFEFDSRCCAGGTPRFRTGRVGPSLTDGAWHNVTMVRDYTANEIRTYIDGDLEHTGTINASNGGDWNMGVNTEALTFGDHLDRFTAGSFDDIAIWKGEALSASDIGIIASGGVGALVPEPSTSLLLGLGSLILIRRRKR